MQKGWDVEFADRCGAARFDFLARQDDVEIEVECKTTSGDTGRKIYRQEVNRLADLMLPTTPILLTHTPARCRVISVAGIKLGIGRRLCVASDAEQRTEGVERVEAPVEPKREFA